MLALEIKSATSSSSKTKSGGGGGGALKLDGVLNKYNILKLILSVIFLIYRMKSRFLLQILSERIGFTMMRYFFQCLYPKFLSEGVLLLIFIVTV